VEKTVHIVGAGGNAGMLAYECLKDNFIITGHDTSKWGELIMPCEIGDPWDADCILPLPDKALCSRYGDSDTAFTPALEQLVFCQDKAKVAEVLGESFCPKLYWVRNPQGSGGKGAQMCSEFLPGRNVSVELCFTGKDTQYFIKERLAYSIPGDKEPTHQFGTSFVSVCLDDYNLVDFVVSALEKVAKHTNTRLYGFYGVDLKGNVDGELKLTEINAGRLLTASYCYYYISPYNLLLYGISSFLGQDYVLEDYPVGWGLIRQMDSPPRLFGPSITKTWI